MGEIRHIIGAGRGCNCKHCALQRDVEGIIARILKKSPFETFEALALRIIRTRGLAKWKRQAAHMLLAHEPKDQKVMKVLEHLLQYPKER